MLNRIKIKQLFGQFDYEIELKEEGVTVLTGPNGYGKSTIFRILSALSDSNFIFISMIPFQQISFFWNDGQWIQLEGKRETAIFSISGRDLQKKEVVFDDIRKPLAEFIKQKDLLTLDDGWVLDRASGKSIDPSYLYEEKIAVPDIPDLALERIGYITEHRIFSPASIEIEEGENHSSLKKTNTRLHEKTVRILSSLLKERIAEKLSRFSEITQELDSTFPRRLFEAASGVAEEEFNQRFIKVKAIQKKLSQFNISLFQEDDHPVYKEENAVALSIYLNDTEKKLSVFSGLLEQLELFTDIINNRRFTFKRINISKEKGFEFLLENGGSLSPLSLSSGEQHEVVLLYMLLFDVEPGSLVLIDEPETSLHVVWQKEFLDDLFKIRKLRDIQFMVATHSPQIINDRWDLTVDLEEISQ